MTRRNHVKWILAGVLGVAIVGGVFVGLRLFTGNATGEGVSQWQEQPGPTATAQPSYAPPVQPSTQLTQAPAQPVIPRDAI